MHKTSALDVSSKIVYSKLRSGGPHNWSVSDLFTTRPIQLTLRGLQNRPVHLVAQSSFLFNTITK